VWILLNPARKMRGYSKIWTLQTDEKDNPLAVRKELYDKMSLILIALGNEKSEDKDIKTTAADLLTVVFSSHKSIEEKRRILKEKFGFQPDELFEREVNTMFHYSEVYLERGMKMERAKTQEILKHEKELLKREKELLKREQEQTRLEKEKNRLEMEKHRLDNENHRLENEKHAKQRQSSAIAMYQDGLPVEKIAAYLNTDKNEILIMLEGQNK
jgi:exonuclease VII large subunit